jgi:AcrR family transcriptional regulator
MCQTVPMTTAQPASPGPGARRTGGRRPAHTSSHERILEVARLAFTANGYTGTSLRGIARDAGVDPSLIVQFFGSKAGLFGAVVKWPFDASQIVARMGEVPTEQVGMYTARMFIDHWDRDEHRNPIISLIHAALADPGAAAMLREFITVNLTLAMVDRVGADRRQFRAALLASQLLGFGLSRYALAFDALRSAPTEDLIAALGATLQHTCTAPLTAAGPAAIDVAEPVTDLQPRTGHRPGHSTGPKGRSKARPS